MKVDVPLKKDAKEMYSKIGINCLLHCYLIGLLIYVVRERERERERESICMTESVYACVCVREREIESVCV